MAQVIEASRRRSSAGNAPARAGSAAGIARMYASDDIGLKVDPVKLLVMSMLFICMVFALHIWGRFWSFFK